MPYNITLLLYDITLLPHNITLPVTVPVMEPTMIMRGSLAFCMSGSSREHSKKCPKWFICSCSSISSTEYLGYRRIRTNVKIIVSEKNGAIWWYFRVRDISNDQLKAKKRISGDAEVSTALFFAVLSSLLQFSSVNSNIFRLNTSKIRWTSTRSYPHTHTQNRNWRDDRQLM